MTHLTFGLATWRAIVTQFEPSRDWLADETDPYERALYRARLSFLDTATVTKWKARVPVPTDVADRRLLADDLDGWALPAGLCDFEFATGRHNTLVRSAFLRAANELREVK